MNTDVALSELRGSARPGIQDAQRESHVQAQMGNLEKVTAALSTQIDQLENRLGKVMAAGCPTSENKLSAPEQNLCQLGNDLREIFRSLTASSMRLREIMSNLEL